MTYEVHYGQLTGTDIVAVASYTTEEFDELCFEFGKQERWWSRGIKY